MEPFGDLGVGEALGHPDEHLFLAIVQRDLDDQRGVFATNVDLESTDTATPLDPRIRRPLPRMLLEDMGALPAG